MFDPFYIIPFALGGLVGALVCWLVLRTTIERLRTEIAAAERFRERTLNSEEGEAKLREAFTAMSAEALAANNNAFLEQAKLAFSELQTAATGDLELRKQAVEQLVEPIRKGLEQVDSKLQAIDVSRAESQGAMQAMLSSMAEAQKTLTSETATLVAALRQPQGRGQWGELQLRRVVELAGMLEHCDFATQHTVEGEDGSQRPDLVVRLPGEKVVVVDAKAPLSAYLDATNAENESARNAFLDQHAKQVRHHVTQLSRRDYANAVSETPDFVVLFLPGEAFFAAACQRDPSLLDYAASKGVVPASPTTLITLLKAVNFGWQQERIARNAEEIRDLGIALYDRMATLAEHLVKVRRGLEGAVRSYNDAMGSLERRVLPTARRFRDLGLAGRREIGPLRAVGGDPLRLASAQEIVDQETLEV
ncbi:MAG: DNA recombination protein RmuC [Gemmatimonadales bacterium]